VNQISPLERPAALAVDDNSMCGELTTGAVRKQGFHFVEAKEAP
jgi:hypothetical protein